MTTDTNSTAQTTAPGTRAVSVTGVPGGKWGGYVAPAIYEARARKDGVITWRRIELPMGHFYYQSHKMAIGFRSERKAEAAAEAIADRLGIAVLDVRHGTVAQ